MQLSMKLTLLAVGAVTATLLAVFLLLTRELAGSQIELPPNLVRSQHDRIIDQIGAERTRVAGLVKGLAQTGLLFGSEASVTQRDRINEFLSDVGMDAAFAVNRQTEQVLMLSDIDPLVADDFVEGLAEAVDAVSSVGADTAIGFLPTSTGLYYLGASKITGSDYDLAILREVDLAESGSPVGLLANIQAIVPSTSSVAEHIAAMRLLRRADRIAILEDGDEFDTFSLIQSAAANDLLIEVKVPRHGLLMATEGLRRFIPLTLLCGLFIAIAFGLWLVLVVARPLKTILHYGDSTLEPNHRDVAEQLKRRDEFGGLARLVRRLRDSVIRAEETSRRHGYRSGMEEMASAILHNVGNTLTPVVVSVDRMLERIRQDRTADIGIAAREIGDPGTPDERREKLIQYFGLMQERVEDKNSEMNDELTKISAQVTRVEEMLSSGELLGNDVQVIEPLEIDSVIRAAVSAVPMKLQGIVNVEMSESLADAEPVIGSKLELIQVVLNILCNASESIEKRGNRDGQIEISAEQTAENGNSCLHVRFKDNGMGVRREQMPFIFEKGFSTKQGRRGGNGLDWCARTIAKLQGRIYAESDGAMKGVTFHLVLPLYDADANQSAHGDVDLKVVA